MSRIAILVLIFFAAVSIVGCSKNKSHPDHDPQPWAQRESWEGSIGLPGFSGNN